MDKDRIRIAVILGICLLVLVIIKPWHRYDQPATQEIATPDYGTTFEVFATRAVLQFWGPQEACRRAGTAIEERLHMLHNRINLFDEDSELARLNATAHKKPFACSPELWTLLSIAREAHAETNGAFDVTIGPLMKLWGFHADRATYPAAGEVTSALQAVGLDSHVVFDDDKRTVRLTHPETYLDFGGLAKGYAVELAREIAEEHGIDTGVIDLGGNIYCFPVPPPDQVAYKIGIRDPQWSGQLLRTLELRDEYVATSGNYENAMMLDGSFVHHIIDPRTGYPIPRRSSVTVVARSGLDTDVYTTAIFVSGPVLAQAFVDEHPDSYVIVVTATDGDREIETFP